MFLNAELSANTKVKAAQPGLPPQELEVVKDIRMTPRVRKMLIEGFWKAQRGISGCVAYIVNDSIRERLRRDHRIMVHISNVDAQHVTVIGAASLFARV